jgi:RNA polymerase sigma-70 factor (ECF subfamily)
MEMTDKAVIEDILLGNIDKFEILVERYSSKVQSFIGSRLFDKQEVDDIVQNSFIHFYKALSSFDTKKSIYPYLLQIARNELYMFFRKKHITVPLNDDIIQRGEEKRYESDISEIVEGMNPDHKKALLWFAEGYSYQEIAKRLKKPLNTVRTLIRRARLFVQKNYIHEK